MLMKHCNLFCYIILIKIVRVEEPGTKCSPKGIADEGGGEAIFISILEKNGNRPRLQNSSTPHSSTHFKNLKFPIFVKNIITSQLQFVFAFKYIDML